jgi:glycine dehydrogenase subunit 1
MLDTIGVKSLEDLFTDIPKKHRFPMLNLPPALTEMEAAAELGELSLANDNVRTELVCFLGAGAYNHYIPAAVDTILRRSEFYTAYTPYQPEISQGTLQSIFEYQSLIVAVAMACAQFHGRRTKVVISASVHPQYRQTLRTYVQNMELELVGDDPKAVNSEQSSSGSPESLIPLIDDKTALVVVQYPDFFGRIYDYTRLIETAHKAGALVCVAANPIVLGLLKTPGEMGADIVVGEGQPLGIPLSYGGPYLGFFATRKQFIHKMAGRLVGETVDSRGQRAYVLTLTAREQHIKRERATSNICTNQGLLALAAAVYLSLLGPTGLRQVAEQISSLPGYSLCFDAPYYHEFPICCPRPVAEINAHLLEHGFLGGYDLGLDFPAMKNHMLLAVTEMNTRDEIDALVDVLAEGTHA